MFSILLLFGCGLPNKIRVSSIIKDAETFRDAEQIYKEKFGNGNYGSIQNLVDNNLLEERFSDGLEHGFKFNLTIEKGNYTLSIIPENVENKVFSEDDEELSLFVDNSGVIRASVKPNVQANSKSSPINPK